MSRRCYLALVTAPVSERAHRPPLRGFVISDTASQRGYVVATLMPEPLATDVLVVDLIEARTRLLMAKRAALPDAYPHRGTRAELRAEIDASLERWNYLNLGR